MLSIIIIQTDWPILENTNQGPSTVELIGRLILGKYLLPFELISILLLSALIGSALLARKKVVNINESEVDMSDKNIKESQDEQNLGNDLNG